jgi:solute carrier family 25 carnitine/acylcarnitine transporter 20/29
MESWGDSRVGLPFVIYRDSMSSDFWAGYLSGALGIIIGNPLDVIKVRLQAGHTRDASAQSQLSRFEKASSLVRGLCDF